MKSDVIIIGAGAAGLMCAIQAGKRGRSVVLLDHARKLAEKIRISGGGRCNFTNLDSGAEHYISGNPHFCRSAFARYSPHDFIAMLDTHHIGFHEKTFGQLFCNEGAGAIIDMLHGECEDSGVQRVMACEVTDIGHWSTPGSKCDADEHRFHVSTSRGDFLSSSLVIATGGLSIPNTGASPFGYRIAEQFGIPVTRLKPGLVPLTVAPDDWIHFSALAGVSVEVRISLDRHSFRDAMLFTHRGLSGPAILQISSYWQHGELLHIDLLPGVDVAAFLQEKKGSKKLLGNFLSRWLPKQFSDVWCEHAVGLGNRPLNQFSDKQLMQISDMLHDWQIMPSGTAGYAKAEVTCGGIDTTALSSRTMESAKVPGLYFIGEVVDVTGQLGGYNFQWAWASGYAAGISV